MAVEVGAVLWCLEGFSDNLRRFEDDSGSSFANVSSFRLEDEACIKGSGEGLLDGGGDGGRSGGRGVDIVPIIWKHRRRLV